MSESKHNGREEMAFAEGTTGVHNQRSTGVYFRRVLIFIAIVLPCLLVGAGVSVHLGQDANWDLRNYHFYNGWAALHGRLGIDLAAAGLQSWINPTLDIPYAWLAHGPLANHPQLLAAYMGLWYGALIAAALGISNALYRRWHPNRRLLSSAAGAALACTGAAVISQVGTTFNEIQTGTIVLLSLLLVIEELDRHGDAPQPVILLLAGGLLGAAAGLKITSALYAPAATLALIGVMPIRRWPTCLASMVIGGIAGFAIGGGWWAYRLYEIFGNPVFPFFNGIFRSPWYPPVNFFDRRFLPHNTMQALFYPFYWLSNKPMLVTEIPFRDGRVAVTFALGLILAGVAAFRMFSRLAGRARNGEPICIPPPQRFLLLFTAGSYLLWLCSTSILRYAIPVEVSAGLVIPLLLALLVDVSMNRPRSRVWIVVLSCIVIALFASTRYPQWGRKSFQKPVVSADMSWVQPHSLVILVGSTNSYAVPFASAQLAPSFVGLTDVVFEARGYRLANAVYDRIIAHKGPIFIVWTTTDGWRIPSLPDMHLREIPASCRTFYGSFEAENKTELHECAATVDWAFALHDLFWRKAAAHYDEIEVPERPVPGWSYVSFVHTAGSAASGKRYVDDFEYLWSHEADRPKPFDERILPHTLYILRPALKERAMRAINANTDLLTTIDGVLVLAPGWKTSSQNSPWAAGR